MSAERLQKVLASAGIASRRDCEELITAGRVAVNGRVARLLGTRVDPEHDEITVDGRPIGRINPRTYVLLHKPAGVVSTADDPQGRPTVVDAVDLPARLFPAGRLDYDSEGLILLTDDGELTQRLTHPSYEVEKEYRALLDHAPTPDAIREWRAGVVLDGVQTAPAWVQVLEHDEDGVWVRVVLHEGRKRQIREVAELLGYKVLRLIRVREGSLMLGDLPPGAWRPLSDVEVEALWAHAGGRDDEPPASEAAPRQDEQRDGSAPPRRRPWQDRVESPRAGRRVVRGDLAGPRPGRQSRPAETDDAASRGFARRDDRPYDDRPHSEPPPRRDDRPYDDRPPRRDDRPYDDRPPRRDDRPPPRDDRPFAERSGGDRPRRDDQPYGDRPQRRDDRPYDDRPAGERPPRRDDRPYDDRPAGERPPRRDDRSYGERGPRRDDRPYGERSGGDRPRRDDRSYGERGPRRDDRPSSDRPQRSGDRPYNDRPYGDRSQRSGDRPSGDRPQRSGDRPYNDRPYGDRSQRSGDRPSGDRPYGDRSQRREGRPSGDRPYGERGPRRDDRPSGDRPQRSGDRPYSARGGRRDDNRGASGGAYRDRARTDRPGDAEQRRPDQPERGNERPPPNEARQEKRGPGREWHARQEEQNQRKYAAKLRRGRPPRAGDRTGGQKRNTFTPRPKPRTDESEES